ncbi:site-specific integrase [Clostridium estertheticum]|uniref:site-specific integrase n=1 Tax=Clostridium estertheticum TaxID=238834 RepID=UPI001C0D9589|nr:site-specific integrase [Clostridium estertheticum]MBU3173374.1 site-specific integrase [Clostridium estertheticum]
MNFVQPIRDKEKIEEIKTLLMYKSYRDYFMFVLGINTGLRISDLLPLKVQDVRTQDYIILKEKKTGKSKRFPINDKLKIEISKYTKLLNDNDYLFPSQKGGHLKRVRAYEILKEVGTKAGVGELGTHSLRKSFGYHFYKKYKDVAMLQKIFNHSAPSVTLRYIGIEQDEIDTVLRDFNL